MPALGGNWEEILNRLDFSLSAEQRELNAICGYLRARQPGTQGTARG